MNPTAGEPVRTSAPLPSAQVQAAMMGKRVCPFCGTIRTPVGDGAAAAAQSSPCPRCTVEDTPATRQATQAKLGPWYVLQNRNPAAPGMSLVTLLTLVERKQVTPLSIVRGPTTQQMWAFAAHVKGLSRHFGLCYACGSDVMPNEPTCPHCHRLQEPPADPAVLLEARPATPAPPQGALRRSSHDTPAGAVAAHADRASAALAAPSTDGLLSARELAAAFNLTVGPRISDGDDDDGEPLAPSADPRARSHRRVYRGLAVALLLVGAVIAGLLYQNPPLRHRTARSFGHAWQVVAQTWDALLQPKPASPAPPPSPPPARTPTPPPSAPAPVVVARPAAAQPRVAPASGPSVPTVSPALPPSAATAPALPADPEAAMELARSLYRQAIDAQARGDFHTAVRLYEQVRLLPRDTWPTDLDLRLQDSRTRAR